MNIETLKKLRKETCTCNHLFTWPGYHAETCPYRSAGIEQLNQEELKYQIKENES